MLTEPSLCRVPESRLHATEETSATVVSASVTEENRSGRRRESRGGGGGKAERAGVADLVKGIERLRFEWYARDEGIAERTQSESKRGRGDIVNDRRMRSGRIEVERKCRMRKQAQQGQP